MGDVSKSVGLLPFPQVYSTEYKVVILKIKLVLGASFLLLVSVQANAAIISNATPVEGAALWEYSVQGSVSNDQGSIISGSMLIDTTVRDWSSPHSRRMEPCECQNFFHIVSFDLRIGDLSFFGEGPFINEGGENSNVNALYFDTEEYPPGSGTFVHGVNDWFLDGAGDYSSWFGFEHIFFNLDGTRSSVSDFFQEAPAFIEMDGQINEVGSYDAVYMNLTRVAPVPAPAAIWLFGTGLIGFIGFGRRRKLA